MGKILVVGNGPSVLDNEYGIHIDRGPWDVCRFNNFQTKGFERYAGTRTDLLCRRACDDVKLWDNNCLKQVLVFVTYCRWTAGMMNVARDVEAYYGHKCEIVGLKTCKEIGEEIDLDQPMNEWASVGILALSLLTKRFGRDNIITHGFDGLVPDKDTGVVSHYFPKPPRDAKFHNAEKELAYINKLGLTTLKEFVNA